MVTDLDTRQYQYLEYPAQYNTEQLTSNCEQL